MAGQDNITHDGTCPGRMEGGDRRCTHTHTHDTDCPTLLLSDIVNKGLPKGVLSKHLWLV